MRLRSGYRLAAVLLIGGLLLAAYPGISNLIYRMQTESEAEIYRSEVEDAGIDLEALWEQARQYNRELAGAVVTMENPFADAAQNLSGMEYRALLSVDESGRMGYIGIPEIHVYLPIYHGTEEETLLSGVGHLEGSSLPTGGSDVHTVLAGHTGLNRARIFTDLTRLEEGDRFYLYILDQTFCYEVRQIAVVEPEDVSLLKIEPGKDLCTLVTCTPYGVNTHRLLVTGERVGQE